MTPLQKIVIDFFVRTEASIARHVALEGMRVNRSPEGFVTISVNITPDARFLQDLADIEEMAEREKQTRRLEQLPPSVNAEEAKQTDEEVSNNG